jgi:hypothetical protein
MTAAAAVPVGLHAGIKRGAERPNLRDPPGGTGISCRAIDHVSHHVMVMIGDCAFPSEICEPLFSQVFC